MYIVYKHTSPSGKVYIGITNQNPKQRWNNGRGYGHSLHFKAAIEKYGWENIKHEILFSNLSQEDAERLERDLIKEYKSTDRKYGYNSDSGGCVNKHHSEETKEKIRLAHLGRKASEETRKKISAAQIGNKNMLGKKHSAETKELLSRLRKGKMVGDKNYFHSHKFTGAKHHASKPIDKLDLDGNYIETRPCAVDFSNELGGCNATHIADVCNGKRKTAFGFKWRYSTKGEQTNELV